MDADAFTSHVAEVFTKQSADTTVTIKASLELEVTQPDGSTHQVFLENLYRTCLSNPKHQSAEIDRFADVMQKGEMSADTILPKNVLPVIRDCLWVDEMEAAFAKNGNSAELAFEPLGADLVILYVCDNPKTVQYLTRQDADALHLSGQTLRELAIQNLNSSLGEIQSQGANGFHFFSAGGCYEPSLLLLDKIWSKFKEHNQGDIVFSIPARDALFVADGAIPEAIAHLAKITPEVRREAPYPVSAKLYVRGPGGRITFFSPDQQTLAS